MSGTYDSSVFISLRPLVPEKVGRVSPALQNKTIPGQVVPLLIWAVPLLIWWVGVTVIIGLVSVQVKLKLELPTGTELGKKNIQNNFFLKGGHSHLMPHWD